jgi:hypothetical protein
MEVWTIWLGDSLFIRLEFQFRANQLALVMLYVLSGKGLEAQGGGEKRRGRNHLHLSIVSACLLRWVSSNCYLPTYYRSLPLYHKLGSRH